MELHQRDLVMPEKSIYEVAYADAVAVGVPLDRT
jgi:hypothetical protein